VQVRVSGPAVPVSKRSRNQAADVDLPDPLRPDPGEQGMLLDERQSVLHSGLWARSITAATTGSATAHKLDTDFTGENVKS
jgi:hypothetical protein